MDKDMATNTSESKALTQTYFLSIALQLHVIVLFDIGMGNKKRLIDISALAHELTQPVCTVLLSMHAFTGCDTTSAFKGKVKVKPLNILQQMPMFVQTMVQLGDNWLVKEVI
jgi:hypothetical protein